MWSEEKLLSLIDTYRNHPVLWNPDDANYYRKPLKSDAWAEISVLMGETEDGCKSKILSLLSSYRREKSKEKKTHTTGSGGSQVYKSRWYAFDALRFLEDRNKSKPSLNTIKGENDSSDEVLEPVQSLLEEAVDPPVSYEAPEQTVNIPTNQDSLLQGITVTNAHEEDECDLYGRLLAKRLRRMPEEDRELMMYEIDGLLIKRRQAKSANDVS